MPSDSDSDGDSVTFNTPLRSAVNTALNMKPVRIDYNNLRNVLTDSIGLDPPLSTYNNPAHKTPPPRTRNQRKQLPERNEIQNIFQEVSADVQKIYKKLEKISQIMLCLTDKVEDLENRLVLQEHSNQNLEHKILKLEETSAKSVDSSTSYATITASNPLFKLTEDRVGKLEYTTSEEERKKRILQISLKHPDIHPENDDLGAHVKEFLKNRLKMGPREVDANLTAAKTGRTNSVIITVSHRRFKGFIYSARKKLRDSEDEVYKDLYINDNLTSQNFSLFMKLKQERVRRQNENINSFSAVYTIDGRIYVKILNGASKNEAIPIKSPADIEKLLSTLNSPPPS